MVAIGIRDLPIPLFNCDEESCLVVNIDMAVTRDGLTTPFALAESLRVEEADKGITDRLLNVLAERAVVLAIEGDVLQLRRETRTVNARLVGRQRDVP